MITIVSRKLDRIRLFRSYDSSTEKHQFISAYAKAASHLDDWGMQSKEAKHCTTFIKPFGAAAATTSVTIKFFPVHAKSGVAIDFTPSKLNQKEWVFFREMLGVLFDGGSKQVINDFKISKLEVAMDVRVPFDEMLCIAPGMAIENLNYLGKGTRYLGQMGGKRTYCIYDKRKQLADKVDVDLGHDLTRIEVRLRHSGKRLPEMATFQKPFDKLIAVRKAALSKLCNKNPDDPVLKLFSSTVMSGGSAHAAYLQLSKHYKKHLSSRLETCSLNLNGKAEAWGPWILQQSNRVLANFIGAENQCN